MQAHASSSASQVVLVSGNRRCDASTLESNSRRAASALASTGIREDETIALLMRNDFPWFEATRAAGLLGIPTVPINWHLTPGEVAYILEDCNARVLVVHADLLSPDMISACGAREIIAVPTPPEVADPYGVPAAQSAVPANMRAWAAWISEFPEYDTDAARPVPPMFYTSGTTGQPKGVRRKGLPPEIAADTLRRTRVAFGLEEAGVRAVMSGPLYHSAPNSYAMRVVADGGLLVLQPRFDAAELLALIERFRISHLHMVPTMFVRLLALPEALRTAFDPSGLRHVCHGAAPCPPEVKRRMIDWWGPVIHEYYAMTETGVITTATSEGWLAHPGSVGAAASGVTIRIVDAEGAECPVGTPGEILISSAATPYFAYHRADAKTAAARRGDCIATGDVGYLDADGYLYISDRKSDMVISGGVNIYPAEVEQQLLKMIGVSDCAVFGIPDAEFGERLVAMIETQEELDEVVLRAALRAQLAGYKVPKELRFVRQLPREDTGKIRKRLLREEWLAR